MDEGRKIERYQPAGRAAGEERRTPLDRNGAAGTEERFDLLAYWWVVRRRYRTVLTTFFCLLFVVLIGTLLLKPIYRAEALLEIVKESPDIPTVGELFELAEVSNTHLETQHRILRSTSLARTVIQQLKLEELSEFNPPSFWPWSKKKESKLGGPALAASSLDDIKPDRKAYQKTLENFMEKLSVNSVRRSRLIRVSFESHDRELAARVVNTLVSNHIEQTLKTAQEASQWLSQQLSDLKARLEESERELQQYVYKHGLLFLQTEGNGSVNIINEQLRQLQEKLTEAQTERFHKESLYGIIEKGDYTSIPALFEDRVTEDLAVRLAELNRQQAQRARTATPGDLKANEIQGQIEDIEKVLTREREHAARRIRNDYLAAVRREELVRQAFEEEGKRANLIAGKLVQYNVLKREVETNRELYEGLLQRLKESIVSTGRKSTNIRIVDAAEPPWEAVRPRILLNLALAAALGLGLGVGGAFLQEYAASSSGRVELSERKQSS